LLLGGALAHFFGGAKNSLASAPTLAAAPSPALTPAPILTSPPPVTPSPTHSARPSPLVSATPTATATSAAASPAPARTPKPRRRQVVIVATPQPTAPPLPAATAAPAAAMPSATPTISVSGDDRAVGVVRSYLEALARGDRSTAASYLANGAPSETFMTSGSRIETIRAANVGPQQYHVTADVETASGEYFATFTVEQGPIGLQITDHYAIKPQ
jgi:hypothetical protein